MKYLAITTTLAALAVAGAAQAQDTGFYIGGDLGLAFGAETDTTFTPATVAGTMGDIDAKHDLGYQASVFGGYDFGPFRVEAEALHLSVGVDEMDSDFALGGGLVAGSQGAEGDMTAFSYMANIVADFGRYDDMSFFVGAGFGEADLEAKMVTTGAGGFDLVDDKDSHGRTAWQLFGGVRKPLAANIDGHIRYRYFSAGDFEFVGLGGRAVQADFTSHAISAGISYRF